MPPFKETLDFSKTNFLDRFPFPSPLHSVVLPLLFKKHGHYKCLGSCFVIDTVNGFVVTAKHNLDGLYSEELSNSGILDGEVLGRVMVFYSSTKKENETVIGGMIPVVQINFDQKHDLAILRIAVPQDKKTGKGFLNAFPLSFEFPDRNESCVALGYNKLEVEKGLKEGNYNASFNIVASQGVILDVHYPKRDSSFLKFPCFQFNSKVESGMSGGPVFHETKGVCGIVSSSFDLGSPNKENENLSFASLSCMLLAIRLNINWDDPNEEKTTFYQMVVKGGISFNSGFENLKKEDDGSYFKIYFKDDSVLAIQKGKEL